MKKKNGFIYTISNMFLILVCLAILFLVYGKLISIDNFYKTRYPTYYKETVEKYATEYELDPYLIYSIIRAESYYDPSAVSKKGALGLMQIMPETASWIAEKLKIENFTQEDLLDPEKNIMMGVWYFRYLYDKFDCDLKVTIAAYNAGPTNAQKWLERKELSGDGKTLSDIPFEETKKYERKIMNSYTMYKKIYEGNQSEQEE